MLLLPHKLKVCCDLFDRERFLSFFFLRNKTHFVDTPLELTGRLECVTNLVIQLLERKQTWLSLTISNYSF